MEEVILRRGGFDFRRLDFEFLKGPCFVTERLIDAYFDLFLSASKDIFFVPSSTTYWLSQAQDAGEINDCFDGLDLNDANLVLFPVNNNRDPDKNDARSDTHWSLLVYDAYMRGFTHFDNHNTSADSDKFAKQIYHNFQHLMPRYMYKDVKERPIKVKPCEFRKVGVADLAKGFNKYDSGLHVIAMAETICLWNMYGIGSFDEYGYEEEIREMDPSVEKKIRERIKRVFGRYMGQDIMKDIAS